MRREMSKWPTFAYRVWEEFRVLPLKKAAGRAGALVYIDLKGRNGPPHSHSGTLKGASLIAFRHRVEKVPIN